MDIRGLTKFSLVDFPGKLACIIFVGRCNFRCPYCHNPYLVIYHESQPKITEDEIFDFLRQRKGKLDGVVISGGEPSLYYETAEFAKKVKSMGFSVKLDTNGSHPERIIDMCKHGLVDMLGIDYKAPTYAYNTITSCEIKDLPERIHTLIRYVVKSNIPCDIRTTVHQKFHSPETLKNMRMELDELGVNEWHLQQFHSTEIIDESLLAESTYSDRELKKIASEIGGNTKVRGVLNIDS
jgi:pyruvate formate lyase activating enzyme